MTSTIGVGQSDARGAFLADHTVALDRSDPEYDAFVNLYDHIQWHRVPNRPLDSEAEIIERLGRWVGGKVLGSIGPKLVAAANDLPRALQRALTEALPEHPHPGASPISVAVPALFGARATDLVLEAPMRGEMPAEASPEASMARFPPESEYFVGRVGAMARASKAMAKASDYTGVLFHGMAGGGKTACALELAYRYEHDRFEYFVWYKAPEEGRAIDNALSDLAQDMEQQIPGFSMAHVVDRTDEFSDWLPKLSERLKQQSILIVLDNLESLLSEQGQWRDARWGRLIKALLRHNGPSHRAHQPSAPDRIGAGRGASICRAHPCALKG